MPGLELLLPFAAATLIFAFMPGPALLYTAAQTLARGRAGGFLAALGLHAGGFVHVAAAAAGLSAIFSNVPAAYLALKIAGALYLIWLGVGIMRGRLDPEALPHVHQKSAQRAFSAAGVITVLMTASVVGQLKRSAKAQRVVRVLGGSVLVGLGAHLAVSRD